MSAPYLRSSIASYPGYVVPLERRPAERRLDLNENHHGLAPSCREVMLGSLSAVEEYVCKYPDQGDLNLRRQIGASLGLDASCIFINHGSSAVLQQLFLAAVAPGELVALPTPAWGYYEALAQLMQLRVMHYSWRQCGERFHQQHDLDALRKAKPRVLLLNSPHNPTGSCLELELVHELAHALPDTLVILDEAYWGFSSNEVVHRASDLPRHPNLVMMRTFSKFFGLAGVRVGFGFGAPSTVACIEKLGPPFGIGWPAQQLATESLRCIEHYHASATEVRRLRNALRRSINTLTPLLAFESDANFLLIDCGEIPVRTVSDALSSSGLRARGCAGLPRCIRIGIGTQRDTDAVWAVIRALGLASGVSAEQTSVL